MQGVERVQGKLKQLKLKKGEDGWEICFSSSHAEVCYTGVKKESKDMK